VNATLGKCSSLNLFKELFFDQKKKTTQLFFSVGNIKVLMMQEIRFRVKMGVFERHR